MNKNRELAEEIIKLNEYIDKFQEIKPLLDQISENLMITRVYIENDGCDEWIVRKCIGYLENHGMIVSWGVK